MKAKKILLAMAVVAFLGNVQVFAQNTTDATSKVKFDMNELMDKRCNRMVSELSLDDATAAKFTPLYREYMNELRANHTNAVRCNKKGQCSDAERLECMENGFNMRQKMLDTQKKYYDKFKKILNARQLETMFCRQGHHGGRHFSGDYKKFAQSDKYKMYRNHARHHSGECSQNHCND